MAINATSVQARELVQQDYSQELAVKNAMGASPSAASSVAPQAAAGATAVQPSAATTQGLTSAASQASSGQAQTTAAAQTAQQQQAAAQQDAETFNAPVLRLPSRPTTHAVLRGLAGAMADPTTNSATAARLKEFHDEVFQAEKSMIQTVIDAIYSR